MNKLVRFLAQIVLVLLPSFTLLAQPTHDAGYPEYRAWLDINGDRVQDYCRIVGNPGRYQIACAVSVLSGSTVTHYSLYSAAGIDRGYPLSGGFYSPQPGYVTYCRGVGNSPSPFVIACNLFTVPLAVAQIQTQAQGQAGLTSAQWSALPRR